MKKNINKKTILVYGGNSTEHDVSIITALQIYKFFSLKMKNVVLVYFDKNNNMFVGDGLDRFESYKKFDQKKYISATILTGSKFLYSLKKDKLKELFEIEFVINCFHGGCGENGQFQAMLEVNKIPSSTGDYKSLAVSMDKFLTKQVCVANDIKTVDFFEVSKFDFENNDKIIKQQVCQFDFPVVVKPCSQGSSIGVVLVKNYEEFLEACKFAFKFDNNLIVERAILKKREFNCCCFKNYKGDIVTKLDEPICDNVVISFNDKYLRGNDSEIGSKVRGKSNMAFDGMRNLKRKEVENLDKKVKMCITENSTRLYSILNMNGVVRFDFIFDLITNNLYLGEINAVPGSLGFYFFEDVENYVDEITRASRKFWDEIFSLKIVDAPSIFKH